MRAGCRYLGLLIRRKLKEFKRAAVRSDKTGRSFSAMIHLAAAPCGDITRPRRVDLFGASIGQVLPLAPFGGSPHGLDEVGVVNGMFKTGRGVGPRMHVADEMSIELSHIDGRPHEPA
jgi:hypothetical protein